MSNQRHIIKRQRIELQVSNQADAQGLQNEVSRIYHQSLIPLIDQYCTELSSSDNLHRIALLEIDLGEINPNRMEKDLLAKLGPALRQALAAQISDLDKQAAPHNQQNQPSPTGSQLELLAFFMRTGSLPWWADATQLSLLDDCLTDLIEHAPEALRHLLRELGQRSAYAHRLVAHYADERLADLAHILWPSEQVSLAQDIQTLIKLVQILPISAGWSRRQLRRSFWQHLLHLSSLGETLSSDGVPSENSLPSMAGDALYQAMLRRVAADLGVQYSRLLAEMWAMIDQSRPASTNKHIAISSSLRMSLQRLHQASPPKKQASQSDSWLQLKVALQSLARHFHTGSQKDFLARLAGLDVQLSGQAITPATLQAIFRLLQDILSQEPISSTASLDCLQVLAALDEAGLPSHDLVSLRKTFVLQPEATQQPIDPFPLNLHFSQADERYLDNAGLVILWPFLNRFFDNQGLLIERTFKDEAARQRAVGLLQVLAFGEAYFSEYHLPLNKVLCGMELMAVFDLDPPVSAEEIEGCTDLLQAVITQANILNNMSVSGFRGTFLLRKGILRTRDGVWLLQVERETYDVVLDRFPWSWEWVKLPWMTEPLRVEW